MGPKRLRVLIKYFKDPKLAWEANEKEWTLLGVFPHVINLLREKRKKLEPEAYAEKIEKMGIKWVTIFDPDYPKLLSGIYDPPTVLYYRGRLHCGEKHISIIGTRNMSNFGKDLTERFTSGLVNAGFTIVSGLARGVDSQAHLTTLQEKGATIAVLGSGLNNIFPSQNRGIAAKIAAGFGAVVSEFTPDYPVKPQNFPVRNRIISGLSDAVVVIEAACVSGSLITARLALEQGRQVYAVPGSDGASDLISKGARAVFHPEEILEEFCYNGRNICPK